MPGSSPGMTQGGACSIKVSFACPARVMAGLNRAISREAMGMPGSSPGMT